MRRGVIQWKLYSSMKTLSSADYKEEDGLSESQVWYEDTKGTARGAKRVAAQLDLLGKVEGGWGFVQVSLAWLTSKVCGVLKRSLCRG